MALKEVVGKDKILPDTISIGSPVWNKYSEIWSKGIQEIWKVKSVLHSEIIPL